MEKLNELAYRARGYLRTKADDKPEQINVSCAEVLAIAEAFRALEQDNLRLKSCINIEANRAEAAEAKVKELEQEQAEHDGQIADLQGKFDLALAGLRSKTSRCDKAEAKLAELQNQKPIGRVDRGHVSDSNEYPDARVVCLHEHVGWEAFQDGTELFTRPAPAINLAEMVPDEMTSKQASRSYGGEVAGYRDGFNACRAAIMRNIEGAK